MEDLLEEVAGDNTKKKEKKNPVDEQVDDNLSLR